MPQTNWGEFGVILKEVFLVRRNAYYLGIVIFLYYNWGHSYHALKATISIVMFGRWGKDANGNALMLQSPEYQELYSVYTIDILAGTIAAALLAIFAAMLMIRFMDFIFSYDSALSRESRRLQKWVRRETKHLDNQGRILATLRLDQEAKTKGFQTIKRMEDILIRYEQRAAMLNPHVPKLHFRICFQVLKKQKQTKSLKKNDRK